MKIGYPQTIKLRDLFQAKGIKGYEINDSLIRKAKQRGLLVEKINLEKDVPTGEMAIIYGVLYHIHDQETFLNRIQNNFHFAVFVEPIRSCWALLDGGEPLSERDWQKLFNKVLEGCQFLRFQDHLYVFWEKN